MTIKTIVLAMKVTIMTIGDESDNMTIAVMKVTIMTIAAMKLKVTIMTITLSDMKVTII